MILDQKKIDFEGKVIFETTLSDSPQNFFYPLKEEASFIHVKQGHNTAISHSNKVNVPEGNIAITGRGNLILRTVPNEDTGLHQATVIHFYKDYITSAFSNRLPDLLKSGEDGPVEDVVTAKPCVLVNNYIDSVLLYLENPHRVNREIIELKIKEILLLLLQSKKAPEVMVLLENTFSQRSVSFTTTIESHLFSDISLSELAHLSNMSLSTFKRTFRDIYKSTPGEYILAKRLEKSEMLLSVSNLSIMEIAFETGFKTVNHFSKKFKEKYELTPSRFRMDQRDKKMALMEK